MKIKLAFLSYCVMGFMTFAHVYDSFPPSPKPNPDQIMGSLLAGMAWPIYVGGEAALAIVRTAKATSVCH